MTPDRPRLFFPALDALRGFAALSVLVYHVIEHTKWTDFPGGNHWPMLWFRVGWLGVDLFFVLSGTVIGLSAYSLIQQYGPNAFRIPFMWRRMLRIAPLYYLTIILYVVFLIPTLVLDESFWRNTLSHLFFVHNISQATHGSVNGVNWSIGVEMQFYVFMVLLSPYIFRPRGWMILVAMVGGAWAWRLAMFHMVGEKGVYDLFFASTQLPGTLDEFAIGILISIFVRSDLFQRILREMTFVKLAIFAGGVCVFVAVMHFLTVFNVWGTFWSSPYNLLFGRYFIGIAFGALVIAACVVTNPRVIALIAPLRFFGTISYGLYLWHLLVIMSYKQYEWIPHGTMLAITLTITIILATISWYFFEKPILDRYARHSFAGVRAGVRASAPSETPGPQPTVPQGL
ncbi:acyltransferase [Xanthobacter sp. VNH20]|uniref:acyltransferase family protein n=1 Tax=Xanthobacter sp. VNH20 TaxID=3156616 RepID=UPI0032B47928